MIVEEAEVFERTTVKEVKIQCEGIGFLYRLFREQRVGINAHEYAHDGAGYSVCIQSSTGNSALLRFFTANAMHANAFFLWLVNECASPLSLHSLYRDYCMP